MTEAEQMQRIEDKKICLIYTGGTIGMSRTDSGYAPIAGHFQHELDRIDAFVLMGCLSMSLLSSRHSSILPT